MYVQPDSGSLNRFHALVVPKNHRKRPYFSYWKREKVSLVPRPHPAYRHLFVLQATTSWAAPGNEAQMLAVESISKLPW